MDQGNPKHKLRLGGERIDSRAQSLEEDFGVGKKLNLTGQCVLTAQKLNCILGCIESSVASNVEGGDSRSLIYSHETPPGTLHPALGYLAQEGHRTVGESPEKGHQDDQLSEAPLL
ncbi:hypothetical protein BTVI_48689 [Pitangus sulphuratus]|nr:hypothetical protein BTVI_48689 [Pitangus sulphuratus]